MRIDLHVHSNRSDGVHDPSVVARMGLEGRLDVLAITDHDTHSGYASAFEETQRAGGPLLIEGVEFTTWFASTEVHILGYFPQGTTPKVHELMRSLQSERIERMRQGVEALSELGLVIQFEDVQACSKGDTMSRSHLAQALVKKRVIRSYGEAFRKYLSSEHGLIPCPTRGAEEVIALIAEEGGVSVWAHPSLDLFDAHIHEFKEMGLEGVEVYFKRASGAHEYLFEKVSDDLGLLRSGGSDWHGHPGQGKLGTYVVPGEQIEGLLERLGIPQASSPQT
ncbi:MAG: PHP domain-containing protein [Planctomycetota bacterium]|jgi:hypothetical protein|nr:PHP domain-containing protein [Planctomycetota bacterium]